MTSSGHEQWIGVYFFDLGMLTDDGREAKDSLDQVFSVYRRSWEKNPGQKLDDAREQGVKTLDEAEFLALLREAGGEVRAPDDEGSGGKDLG
jgi:hypothetical protein